MKGKKLLSLMVISAILATTLFSCGDSGDSQTEDSTEPIVSEAQNSDTTYEKESTAADAGIPKQDFEGDTLLFFTRDNSEGRFEERSIYAEELTGEPINDAVFERNGIIEDKYNVKIAVQGADTGTIQSTAQNSILSQSDEYDCIMTNLYGASSMAGAGLFYDLHTLPNLNFEQPWWDASLNHDLSFGKKLYTAIGDCNLLAHDGTVAMFFNKQLIEEYQLENPYQLVLDGKWTIDKYTEMTVNLSRDLDNDGLLGEYDFWGSICTQDAVWALFNSCGERYAEKDENDYPVFFTYNDKAASVLEKIMACSSVGKTLNVQYSEYNNGKPFSSALPHFDIFGTGRALILSEIIDAAIQLRDYELEFGIIPFPKYDEAQKDYISAVNSHVTCPISIPVTVQNVNAITAVLEDMACMSRNTVRSAYYDVTLTMKLARDQESREMLDIIFGNRISDIGWSYGFGNAPASTFTVVKSGVNTFASTFEKLTKVANKQIETLIEQYRQVEP